MSDEQKDDGEGVGAITKLFPDLSYDLIARLPAGVLAMALACWVTGSTREVVTELRTLTWPPAVVFLLFLFPFLHTVGVVVSAVSWTLVAWWLRPLVYRYLQLVKPDKVKGNWRTANSLEIDSFRKARRSRDGFTPLLTKSRAEMALATNLLSTYLLMTGVGVYAGAPGWFSTPWQSLGVLLLVATVSRTRSYFGWLFA
jgi:hypothetical protein